MLNASTKHEENDSDGRIIARAVQLAGLEPERQEKIVELIDRVMLAHRAGTLEEAFPRLIAEYHAGQD